MTQPDISVIVITYNDAEHLAQAVESVLEQSHRNVEVIVCDDHSTDNTPEVAAALCAQDDRVSYHRRDINAGSPGAPLNDGLDRARGEFIMFLGSDDKLAAGACTALLTAAYRSRSDIVSGMLNRVLLAEGGRRLAWYPELHAVRRVVQTVGDEPKAVHDTLTTNKLYRRDFLERIGARFPDDMLYEDVVFSAITLSQAHGITFIPDEVYEWNVYPREVRESITNQRHNVQNLTDRLRAVEVAEQAFAQSGENVVAELHDKVLAHHLRFYLNDFITSATGDQAADDEWCAGVLAAIKPRLEATPLSAFRRRFIGDRALYAVALEGDIGGVRAVLRGKQAGALAGRIYRDGEQSFWAPRDRESRPTITPLALHLSDVTDKAKSFKAHPEFAYLYELTEIRETADGLAIFGIATDPLGRLGHSGSRLTLRMNTVTGSVGHVSPVNVTETPTGINWATTMPLLHRVDDRDGVDRLLEMHSFDARGEANISVVRVGDVTGTQVAGTRADGNRDERVWELGGGASDHARFEFTGEVAPSPKRVVVIGDVSWNGRYHLGDEAMTEAAVTQLLDRGIEVTLIAGDTEISSEFYGVTCVPVFGFAKQRTREAREQRIAAILAGALGTGQLTDDEAATVAAVKGADAIVIAGGGNLNSNGSHHIYERLTLTRLAAESGIPLYVSSQTVGPFLIGEDRDQLREIAQYATVFGARESTTAALLRELCDPVLAGAFSPADRASIVRTLDDAVLLKPTDNIAELNRTLQLPSRYAVGSFTYHAWSTGLSREEYYRLLAGMLDDVVAEIDVDVVLLPHMGVLGAYAQAGTDNDVHGHDRIVSYTRSGRVRSLPLISAREVLAVTEHAELSVSTRYHPVVFGAAVGVPALGIVTSYYSALRMRGALTEFGMEPFAVPFEHWGTFGRRTVREAIANQLSAHVAHAGQQQQEFQHRWWDAIVASIMTGDDRALVGMSDVVDVEQPAAVDQLDTDLLGVARTAQEGTNMYRMNNMVTVDAHQAELRSLQAEINTLHKELKKARRASEGLRAEISHNGDAIAEMRHRQRPPGAELRDGLRRKLRQLRDH